MIDLEELTENKETKTYLLKHITKNDIFTRFYTNEILIGVKVSAPFREDSNPSFVIYEKNDKDLFFIDFATGLTGDAFDLVQGIYNCSFIVSIRIILNEFGLNKYESLPKIETNLNPVIKRRSYSNLKIGINIRKPQQHDILYWKQFSISGRTLRRFNVKSISNFFVNDRSIIASKYAYAFLEKQNDELFTKIYQPYSDFKWISDIPAKILFGWRQLPKKGELLVITKALKEVMSLYESLDIPAIGIQSEGILISEDILKILFSRFDRVVSMFDNDRQGISISKKYEEYGIEPILFTNYKNYTDMMAEDSIESAKHELKKLLNLNL